MFGALLAHPQEVLHKQHLVYCVRVMSVGCYQGWSGTGASRWFHCTVVYIVLLYWFINKLERLLSDRYLKQ
jgi:hypothetical protein